MPLQCSVVSAGGAFCCVANGHVAVDCRLRCVSGPCILIPLALPLSLNRMLLLRCLCTMKYSDFIGQDQLAFSPQLNPDRIGEIALEYSRWMLQVSGMAHSTCQAQEEEAFVACVTTTAAASGVVLFVRLEWVESPGVTQQSLPCGCTRSRLHGVVEFGWNPRSTSPPD